MNWNTVVRVHSFGLTHTLRGLSQEQFQGKFKTRSRNSLMGHGCKAETGSVMAGLEIV